MDANRALFHLILNALNRQIIHRLMTKLILNHNKQLHQNNILLKISSMIFIFVRNDSQVKLIINTNEKENELKTS